MAGNTTARGEKHQAATLLRAALAAAFGLAAAGTQAQQVPNFPITGQQRAIAQQVASTGVPISELAPNAPDVYTVKSGDTLWAISGIYLLKPWRWPELWGMNLQDIRNPHLIFPGQQLYLEKLNGIARLRTTPPGAGGDPETVRVSPRTRYGSLSDSSLPTLQASLIEPFLAQPLVVEELTLQQAPRIVATTDNHVMLSRGDRAYVRSNGGTPLVDAPGSPRDFRVFRDATPLKNPDNGEILGYEAQYVGQVRLVRSESTSTTPDKDGKPVTEAVPATIDVLGAKEEIRVGDRLLPEPPRELVNYVPHAPQGPVAGRIVSVYGSTAVQFAAQNQIVALNLGARDGMDSGMILAILRDGERIVDRTDPSRPLIKLPDERSGLLMVFRTFERVSYALILQVTDQVKAGDRVTNPN